MSFTYDIALNGLIQANDTCTFKASHKWYSIIYNQPCYILQNGNYLAFVCKIYLCMRVRGGGVTDPDPISHGGRAQLGTYLQGKLVSHNFSTTDCHVWEFACKVQQLTM